MKHSPEVLASAASDAYKDRPQSDVDKQKQVFLSGQKYQVIGYKADSTNGFHATAYLNKDTNEVIIAYRSTDTDFNNHRETMVQDALVDLAMVKDKINPQKSAADAFTQDVLNKAQAFGISKDQVAVAGHSLGGTLAEIEAHRFGLQGVTLNAYGAVDLGYGIPPGGSQVTNYVMAGDPVSAASRHYGQVVALASEMDVVKLEAARYLNAPPGAAEPNPLLAMNLDDHTIANFTGLSSILQSKRMENAERNYAHHEPSIDRFRGDMYNSRAELAAAMNRTDQPNLESTYAHLSPRMQQQLAEYHASFVDVPIQNVLEHNRVVEGAKHGLDQTGAAFNAGGHYVQRGADQTAHGFQAAGQVVEQQADEVSRVAPTFAPLDPLAATGIALGAKATGYVAHAEAEGYAQASHLAGQAAHATGQFIADQTQTIKHGVEYVAHVYAGAVESHVHEVEANIAHVIDAGMDAYARAEKMGDAVGHAYTETKQAVSHGIDATERAVGQAYDTLTHPGQWFERAPSPETSPASDSARSQQGAVHGESGHVDRAQEAPRQQESQGHASATPTPATLMLSPPLNPLQLRDFSDPSHPQNALYSLLKEEFPPGVSPQMLSHCTAVCYMAGIKQPNDLGNITGMNGSIIFESNSLFGSGIAKIDMSQPTPSVQQTMQNVQQFDQQQAINSAQFQAQQAQINAQAPQGPTP